MNLSILKHFMAQPVYDNSGFVTLISVLVIGSIATLIVLTTLFLGVDYTKSTINTMQFSQAKYVAEACTEEALQRINLLPPYAGTDTLNVGNGSCTFSVTSGVGQNKTVTSTGNVGMNTRKIYITLDVLLPTINITSWQEVADF
jgi:hypothetical protein